MASLHSSWVSSFVARKLAEEQPLPDAATGTDQTGFAPVEGSMRLCGFGKPQFFPLNNSKFRQSLPIGTQHTACAPWQPPSMGHGRHCMMGELAAAGLHTGPPGTRELSVEHQGMRRSDRILPSRGVLSPGG